MVTADQVAQLARSLPGTEQYLVGERLKFRVGRIVYATISADERALGIGFPLAERAGAIAGQPAKFFVHRRDERYQWIEVWLDRLDAPEMCELVIEAWRMVVPKRLRAQYDRQHP